MALPATFIALWSHGPLQGSPLAPPKVPSDHVSVDRSGVRKICQVVGESDRQTGRKTINATETNYGFWGTDLGSSFEHDGRLYFLFGDTHASGGLQRGRDRDLVAVSDDADPDDCLTLSVITDPDGGYRPLTIPSVSAGEFSVPTGGFSANGKMYVFATTDYSPSNPMGRSVLASSADGGHDFDLTYNLSTDKFINVAPVKVNAAAMPGLPAHDRGMKGDEGVLMWGSGSYRKSSPYLAFAPAGEVEDKAALRYFAGTDPKTGAPMWSREEADSAPLFKQACVGELSVAWNPYLNRWVMLYNCGAPHSQILLRTAEKPWGPWSESQVLFDAERDSGFCRFLNAGSAIRPAAMGGDCQTVADPHNPATNGDPYAPYMISSFTKGVAGGHSDIYFMMSTWNPYTVVLMKATLRLTGAPS
ncbi:MAG TPA: DUF4185 domain-containing protein [Azospirillaceae bacterium]|nr:DUF4185 domain-containing protein [Azospirillaceae bacterium]